jgi:hypothetical protein
MKRPPITPGPWNFTKGVIPCIFASIDRHQVNVAKTIYGSHDEALTNARAIAALPALLEALEKCHAFFREVQRCGYCDHEADNTRSALRLAGYEF